MLTHHTKKAPIRRACVSHSRVHRRRMMFRSAVYSPSDGRWTRRDLIGEIASLNLYSYAYNLIINLYNYLKSLKTSNQSQPQSDDVGSLGIVKNWNDPEYTTQKCSSSFCFKGNKLAGFSLKKITEGRAEGFLFDFLPWVCSQIKIEIDDIPFSDIIKIHVSNKYVG